MATGTTDLWLLSLDGSDPKRIAGFAGGDIRVHPDGRRIAMEEHAFVGAPPPDETWVLENFLPSGR